MQSVENINGGFGGGFGGGYGGYGGYDSNVALASFGYGALAANSGHGASNYGGYGYASSDPLCSLAIALGDVKSELLNNNHNQTVSTLQGQNDIRRDIAKSECDIRADVKDVRFDLSTQLNTHDRNVSDKFCALERRLDEKFCDNKALLIEKFNGLEMREVGRELKSAQLELSQCRQNEALRGIANETAARIIAELKCAQLLCPPPAPEPTPAGIRRV